MTLFPYIGLLFLIGFFEVILRAPMTLWNAQLELPIMLVVLVAMYQDDMTALWFGFFAGLVAGAGNIVLVGASSLIFGGIGFASYLLRYRLNLASRSARLLLVVVAVLLFRLAFLMIDPAQRQLPMIWLQILPSLLLSTIVAWICLKIADTMQESTRRKPGV